MTTESIRRLLAATGLPVTYQYWEENEVPDLPYICYMAPQTNNFFADGKVYFTATKIRIELYTEYIDPLTELKLTNILDAEGYGWNRQEERIESEGFYQITFEIEV